jgi:hypothetical protein
MHITAIIASQRVTSIERGIVAREEAIQSQGGRRDNLRVGFSQPAFHHTLPISTPERAVTPLSSRLYRGGAGRLPRSPTRLKVGRQAGRRGRTSDWRRCWAPLQSVQGAALAAR